MIEEASNIQFWWNKILAGEQNFLQVYGAI